MVACVLYTVTHNRGGWAVYLSHKNSNEFMTKTLKTVLSVLVLVAVAAALYFGIQWYQSSKNAEGSAVFIAEPAVLPSGTSTTDDSLAKDAAAIDAALKSLDADSVSAEASLTEAATVQ